MIRWHTSSRCANDENCVAVADIPGAHLVKDTKDKDSPQLAFPNVNWGAFIHGVKTGTIG
jgi:hypothetical protein